MRMSGGKVRCNNSKAAKLKDRGSNRQQEMGGREGNAKTLLLSLTLLGWKREGDDRIIIPLPLAVQESSQPLHLRGEIHNDNLHLNVQVELKNLRARRKGLHPCGDKHVSLKPELLECIDHLAKFCAPGQHSKLQRIQAQMRSR